MRYRVNWIHFHQSYECIWCSRFHVQSPERQNCICGFNTLCFGISVSGEDQS